MAGIIKDLPVGPLDLYRKKASFDWKKMKLFIHTADVVEYENELVETLQQYPEFQHNLLSPTLDEQRHIATRQDCILSHLDVSSINRALENTKRVAALARTLMQLCPSAAIKSGVRKLLCASVIRSSGTERHEKFLELLEEGEIHGCFCLTEIGHGSNSKSMRTTATYDKEKKEFILHSPDFEAAKCWAGALGQTASMGVVYAQLIIENVNHGLHLFVVPIRNPRNLIAYPGVVVGDMGEKIGLNGIDNGFVMFENYRIPRENLLNKNGDVTEDGQYITSFKSARDRHGAALGTLSMGRVSITGYCEQYGTKALTIAIRYAAVRKQFGPDEKKEVPILEYQSHQFRLLPYLAAAYAFRVFSIFFTEEAYGIIIDSILGQNKDSIADRGMELHVLSSASKPVAGWLFRDAIQECREACGGHGYLKAAGIGEIRNNHDANCTYEGENHVLIQQTCNWLFKTWPLVKSGKTIKTPLHSADFLSDALKILTLKSTATSFTELTDAQNILQTYQWLTCYLLEEAVSKYNSIVDQQGDFWAKNNTQVYYAKTCAITFVQHFILQRMSAVINEATDANIKIVLKKLFALYGLWSLEKHVASLYEGGYFQGSKPSRLLKEAILQLCSEIKDDAVSLIDAIAPPDFILNSVLGFSDGQVYQHLKSSIFRSPYAMSRPTWWNEIVNWNSQQQSKL